MAPKVIGVFLFNGFELLDVAGPLEMWSGSPDHLQVKLLGPDSGPVTSVVGGTRSAKFLVDDVWETSAHLDILMVPGGRGARTEVTNERFLTALRAKAAKAELVTSVCTGAALLAKAGLLDGKRATSNKRAFAFVKEQGPKTTWVPQARWVVDGNVMTSGGVAAGMDMALALVAKLRGDDAAARLASGVEYDWHRDADWDPFAKQAGLV